MTPPDSGELCNATLGEDRVVYQCSRPKGHTGQHRDGNVTAWDQKSDSGEREVRLCAATRTDRCERNSGHDGAHWPKPTEHATWKDDVLVPLPLAQRILAVVEADAKVSGDSALIYLASELRAAVERKP